MNRTLKNILPLILGMLFLSTGRAQAVKKSEKTNWQGRMEILNGYTGIRNRNITGLPFGYHGAVNLYGRGHGNNTDISGRVSVIYNSWDQLDLFDGFVKVKKNHTDVQLGNVRADFSRFTVLNKNFLGVQVHHEIIRESADPSPREVDNLRMQLLRIPRVASVNAEEVYDQAVEDRPKFRKTDLTIVFGQTEKSIELDEKVDFQNGRHSAFPQFQQIMTAARVQTEPVAGSQAGLGIYHFKDRPASVQRGGVGTRSAIVPQENLVFGLDGGIFLFSDRFFTEGEFAYSKLDENLFSEADTFIQDHAFRVRSRYRVGNLDLDFSYRRVGGDFLTLGNEMTRTVNNRSGIYSITRYLFPFGLRLDLKVDRYRDNLNNRNLFTHTFTRMDGTLDFSLPVPTRPRVLLNFRQSRDRTPEIAAGLILSEGNISRSGSVLLQSTLGKTFLSASYTELKFDDRYTYSLSVVPNDFKNRAWVVSILDRTIPRTQIRVNLQRIHNRFIFRDQDDDRRRGQVNLTVDLIPDRLRLQFSYLLAKNVDSAFTLKEDRKRAGLRLRLGPKRWLGFHIENERMHYTPEDIVREFNARKIETSFETRF